MRLIAVTTCTDRKRFPIPPDLDASSLPLAPQTDVVCTWRKRIHEATRVGQATDVYGGRSFQEAVIAARAGRGDFRIISGGLGLVRGDEAIPAYSLSLIRSSSEFIGSRITSAPFSETRWWSEVQNGEASPLARLLYRNRDAVVVIAISSTYLSLIADDLLSLKDNELDRVRLIGLSIEKSCPLRLQRCILPYDDRLDGEDSPIRGTRGDFSSRAMRHFIEYVLPEHKSGSIEPHKAAVGRRLGKWRRPKLTSRPSRTDEEIIQLIKNNWQRIQGQSSKGLRYLRDVEEIACEQGRFRMLFSRAASEVMS